MLIPVEHSFWTALVLVWGGIWGSFLNVVIYRVPRGLSVVSPPSACGRCGTPVPWYHNLPVLSWFILRGRCFRCRAPFSIRYPLVEAAIAVLALAIWWKLTRPVSGAPPPSLAEASSVFLLQFFFICALVAIALIDLDTMYIPDGLSLPPIFVGLLTAWFFGDITGVDRVSSILGMLIGGGTLLVVTLTYSALFRREGMGMGDYRLLAMVGAWLGWASLLFLLVASSLQGIVFALVARVTGLDRRLPHPAELDVLESAAAKGQDLEAVAQDATDAADAARDDESMMQMALPFGPFIVLAALEWFLFEAPIRALFDALVFRF